MILTTASRCWSRPCRESAFTKTLGQNLHRWATTPSILQNLDYRRGRLAKTDAYHLQAVAPADAHQLVD